MGKVNFSELRRLHADALSCKVGGKAWLEFASTIMNVFPSIYAGAFNLQQRNMDVENALQAMVSAQHAGPVTPEMLEAWDGARSLLKRTPEAVILSLDDGAASGAPLLDQNEHMTLDMWLGAMNDEANALLSEGLSEDGQFVLERWRLLRKLAGIHPKLPAPAPVPPVGAVDEDGERFRFMQAYGLLNGWTVEAIDRERKRDAVLMGSSALAAAPTPPAASDAMAYRGEPSHG